jgi:Alpha-tubulin suppressor and related RCC1 domain-containing proteins
VALLTDQGELYTLGCAEQGQLGRVGERFVARGGRRGLDLLLKPDRVHAPNRKIDFINVWAGSYATYALTSQNEVMVCGLNNYNQLGIERGQMFFTLKKSDSFSSVAQSEGWSQIAPGQHHTIALDARGTTYAIGRVEYGRLGLGDQHKNDALLPVPIPVLKNRKVVNVSSGTAVSFAVADSGEIFSWGMGTNGQLGHEDDEDAWEPQIMLGKQLETRRVLLCSGGGQHTIMMAKEK